MGISSVKTHLFGTWASSNTAPPSQRQAQIQKRLENATVSEVLQDLTPNFDLKELLDAATKSFNIFKPFCEQIRSFENPIIREISENIRKQYYEYRLAINASIKSAQLGYTFADNGVTLCGYINNESQTEIISYIKTMDSLAREAHELADKTGMKFRTIRQKILEISESILAHVRDHENGGSGSVSVESLNDKWGPEKLPLYTTKSFSDALKALSRDVAGLGTQVGSFAAWWGETEMKLGAMVFKVGLLDPIDLKRLRVETIRLGWIEVRNRYSRYIKKIAFLEDTATPSHSVPDIPAVLQATDILEDTAHPGVQATKAKRVSRHKLLRSPFRW